MNVVVPQNESALGVILSSRISEPIQIYYQNVRGVRTKIHELRVNIPLFNYNVYAFSETRLNSNTNSEELGFVDCNIYRFDRNASTSDCLRGGVVL